MAMHQPEIWKADSELQLLMKCQPKCTFNPTFNIEKVTAGCFTGTGKYDKHSLLRPEPSSEGNPEVELRLMGHLLDCSL